MRSYGSLLALLCALVLTVLIAAPRSGQTTLAAPRDLSELRVDRSAGLIGAPQIPQHWPVGDRTGAGGPNALHIAGTRRGAPQPSGEVNAISSGLASWYRAAGDVASAPWWRPGQDPVLAIVSTFGDGRTQSVTVLVLGWCQCHAGARDERAIDLSRHAFAQLADPDVGLVVVTIEVPGG